MTQADEITAPLSEEKFSWPLSWVAHYFVAVVGGMIIGFLPEAFVSPLYYNTGFEPYSPMIALIAFCLGYFAAVRIFNGRAATFVWIIGLAWMAFGIFETTRNWNPSWSTEKNRWANMLSSLFGPTLKCSGGECLGELFFTTPFTASVTYSIGVYVRKIRDAASRSVIVR